MLITSPIRELGNDTSISSLCLGVLLDRLFWQEGLQEDSMYFVEIYSLPTIQSIAHFPQYMMYVWIIMEELYRFEVLIR